jgi:hypothetical protein
LSCQAEGDGWGRLVSLPWGAAEDQVAYSDLLPSSCCVAPKQLPHLRAVVGRFLHSHLPVEPLPPALARLRLKAKRRLQREAEEAAQRDHNALHTPK